VKKEKSRILAQLLTYRDTRPGPFWASVGVASLSMFGMVAAFGTAPSTLEMSGVQQTVVESLALPTSLGTDTSNEGTFVREDRIQHGDTVSALLSRLGIQDSRALAFMQSSSATQPMFRQLSPGKTVTAQVGLQGELRSLIFPLNGGKDRALYVERQGTNFTAVEKNLKLETQVLQKSAEIRYSLFGATDAAGIPDSVATQLADIFGGDIDFHRDLRKGDRFSVIYESVHHLGKFVRTGRILAAEFVNGGKTFHAIWFEDEEGKGGYYTPDGRSIRKAFLRSPLEFSRITSGFSTARLHPVLQTMRAHKGIDYGAPVGTHVKSTGDGIVEFVGIQGGYGKVVVLRHQSQYTTLYGHLSGFAQGLHQGSRVSQGDVIGYVGATGLATGPHLHYEFRIGGVHQNPLSIALPTALPLSPQQLVKFREYAGPQMARIDMIHNSNLALLD
jgi:murein DD-endopeptidase MepM/ murein hydrolase activator NlpD